MSIKGKKFTDDGWAIWIDGDDTSTIYFHDWMSPKGKSYIDVSVKIVGIKGTSKLCLYVPFEVSAEEIDTINILNASITGMQRAVRRLSTKPEFLLIDGNKFKPFDDYKYQCIVKGDGKFASIAAASVLAKTYRDEYMRKLALEYPQYGWERNMGYPTKEHVQAIIDHGYTPHHRKSFHLKQLEPTLF
jgi:ribonuclease HII